LTQYYFTIKELEKSLPDNVSIIEIRQENKWVVALLSSNVKIKLRNF